MPTFAFLMDEPPQIRAVFEDFLSLEWNRRFFIPAGAFSMEINLNQLNAAEIRKGTFIGVTDDPERTVIDRLLRVEQIEFQLDREGAVTEVLSVTGRDVSGMLEERLALPPEEQAHDSQDGPVESVMKHYVDANAGPGADTNRRVPDLVIATDQGRGEHVSYDARYQTVAQLLEELSVATDIGWEITFDIDENQHVFDVIMPTDRTIGSPTPVVFDTEFGTVESQHYLSSDLDRKTLAIVGGPGSGAEREITEAHLGEVEPAGFERRELFVDARDMEREDALKLRGKAALAETIPEDVVEAVITSTHSTMRYRREYDLGDIVTVRNRKWGLQVPMRIVGVTNRILAGRGTIEHVLALEHPFPTIKDRIMEQFVRFDPGRRV